MGGKRAQELFQKQLGEGLRVFTESLGKSELERVGGSPNDVED
jgi:hypothetical protein